MSPLPYATGELPGVAASIKAAPEDFQVDEIPLYPPSGAGEHLFVRVEKVGRDTLEVAKEIALRLGASPRDVGIAGQKDRQAVTTQWLSLAGPSPEAALSLEGEGWKVIEAARHGNKLRTGHLKGNRFRIRLRGVGADEVKRVRHIVDALRERGLPNFFGSQRFGRAGDNAEMGRKILLGELDSPEARKATRNHRLRRLMVSAFQSEIFNRILAERMEAGTWASPMVGDVLQRLESGGLFVCEDPEVDGPRVASFECSVTGPLPGPRMRPLPSGEPAAIEDRVLAATGVPQERLGRSAEAPGTRRPFRLPVQLEVQEEEGAVVLAFDLPPGAYATSLLREITKG